MNNQQMQPIPVIVTKPSVNGLGIAGMVIGIVAILLSCTFIGGILGIIGFILSICGFLPKNAGKGMTIAGTVLNLVAMVVCLIVIIVTFSGNKEIITSVTPINPTTKFDNIKETQKAPNVEKETTEDVTQDDTYGVGSVIETQNLIITYLSCDDYESDNDFISPKDGYKYISACFEFENIGKSDEIVSAFSFECYADGYAMEQTYIRDDMLSSTISSGRKAKGSVTFEVPVDAESIDFEYSLSYFSDEKIIFIAE